jgi:hypothetical protein
LDKFFFSHFHPNVSDKNAAFDHQTNSYFNTSVISNSLFNSRPQQPPQQPVIKNESYYSQYDQQQRFSQPTQVEQKSVRTSAHILPDQGQVPLMMPVTAAPATRSSSASFSTSKSFQHISPTQHTQTRTIATTYTPATTSPTARSRSYEHSQTETSFSRQVPVLHQGSPLKVDTGSARDLYSRYEHDDNSGSSPTYLERFHSPTKKSNYSFERYQQSLGTASSGPQFKPFETRGDSFASKFNNFGKANKTTYYNEIEQQQPNSDARTYHKSVTDLAEQEFIFRPSTGTGLNLQTPVTSPRRPIVEEPISPQFKSYANSESQQQQMYHYEPARVELVRRLPPVVRKREGGMVKLELEISGGDSNTQVSWFKNGILMRDAPDTRIVSNGYGLHTLIIPELFGEDSGLYKVLISSPSGGHLESYCQLVVEGFY